jgi:predicted PurR-regulated permease PerM
VLAVAYLAAQVLVRLRLVVVPVIVALLLTTLLLPPVEWLRGRGWPSAAATWSVLLVAVLALAAAGYALTVLVVPQLGELAGQVSGSLDRIRRWLVEGPLGLSQNHFAGVLLQQLLRDRSDLLVRQAIGWTTLLVELLTGVLFAWCSASSSSRTAGGWWTSPWTGSAATAAGGCGRLAGAPGRPCPATCEAWRSSGWSTAR